jgi:hypothetical protein
MKQLLKHYTLYNVIVAIFFIVVISATANIYFGYYAGLGTAIVLTILSFAPFEMKPKNALFDMVYRTAYTGEMRTFVSDVANDTFTDGINDVSSFVKDAGNEAQSIHIAYMGVMPDVLINNTTYPIPIQDLAIDDMVITLDKYQTKVTPITDDELYAATASKRAGVVKLHGTAIAIQKMRKSLHALAPSGNTSDMPVLVTTGADDGTGRLRLRWEDINLFKNTLDRLEIPEAYRRLVLCSDHVNDLTLTDQKFKDAYYNRETGKIYSQLGFDIRDHLAAPYYNYNTKNKLSFGATVTGTVNKASVFFRTDFAAKATGLMKVYIKPSEIDPENQRSTMSWRHNFIVMPIREQGRGAIVSGHS